MSLFPPFSGYRNVSRVILLSVYIHFTVLLYSHIFLTIIVLCSEGDTNWKCLVFLVSFLHPSLVLTQSDLKKKISTRVRRAEEDHNPDMCEHPLDSGCVYSCRICRFLKSIDRKRKTTSRTTVVGD